MLKNGDGPTIMYRADVDITVFGQGGHGAYPHKTKDPVMGGEDFARYGRTGEKVPGSLLWLGTVSERDTQAAAEGKATLPSLHSTKFAPDEKPAITTGVKGLSDVLIGLF